jgi:iron(III) transport system permease protein
MLGVAVGTLIGGVGTAWLTSMCRFPGRGLFEWALLLPMAMPAYIIAYTYTGMLDFAGPVQTLLRDLTGWGYGDYWFPRVRSLPGAALMLSLVLYPYVYLLTRAAFLSQSLCVLDVSRTLGNGPWRTFFTVALPLARPAIVAGLSLALMETLADYGTVQYFGVSTFTTGIFRTWFGLGSTAAAAQLAACCWASCLRWSCWSAGRAATPAITIPASARAVHPAAAAAGLARGAGGAVLPAARPVRLSATGCALGWWSVTVAERGLDAAFPRLVQNSLGLAAGRRYWPCWWPRCWPTGGGCTHRRRCAGRCGWPAWATRCRAP